MMERRIKALNMRIQYYKDVISPEDTAIFFLSITLILSVTLITLVSIFQENISHFPLSLQNSPHLLDFLLIIQKQSGDNSTLSVLPLPPFAYLPKSVPYSLSRQYGSVWALIYTQSLHLRTRFRLLSTTQGDCDPAIIPLFSELSTFPFLLGDSCQFTDRL